MDTSHAVTFAELLDWLEGRLPAEEAQALAERLTQAGEATQRDLAWLRRFQRLSRRLRHPAPPPELRRSLRHHFAQYARGRAAPSPFQRLVAALTFDSRMQWATAGVRSAAAAAGQRQLIYSTSLVEVVVNVQPRPQDRRLDVDGQVFVMDPAGQDALSVQLVQGAHETALTIPDELGEFTFAALPAGDYELIVSGNQFEVSLPGLPVQP